MGVLVLLGITVAVFAFTLGVHLGKKVVAPPAQLACSTPTITTESDQIPTQQQLAQQADNAQTSADESLNQSLRDEVSKSGLKMDKSRQVDLPTETKKKSGGQTALQGLKHLEQQMSNPAASTVPAEDARKFSLQIGSFPTQIEAQNEIASYENQGLKAFVREAEVKGMGKRFRVFVGEYESKDAAEKAGSQFRSQHLIKSFIVAKITG